MSSHPISHLEDLPSDQLLLRLHELVQQSHVLEAELIAHLGEVDTRRLYLEEACPSMFHYCVHRLHFSEAAAYKRIAVARATRKFPVVLEALAKGEIHLTGASLIAPHLDREGLMVWVAAARFKTTREIREWIADRNPRDHVTTSVRRVPVSRSTPRPEERTERTASGSVPDRAIEIPDVIASRAQHSPLEEAATTTRLPARKRTVTEPLGARRYCIRFEADESVHEQIEELRALLRRRFPDGDIAKILAQAVTVLLEQVRKKKTSACRPPRSTQTPEKCRPVNPTTNAPAAPSRSIPAAVKRAVWERDEGQCTFISGEGRRCGSPEFVEFHHEVPWARRREHAVSNIHLRCRAHNQYAAELDFGARYMFQFRRGDFAYEAGATGAGDLEEVESQLVLKPVGLRGRGSRSDEGRSG
jgi:hypothetical protein